eukprot:940760_1
MSSCGKSHPKSVVILLKREDGTNDRYKTEFLQKGYDPKFIQPLCFEFTNSSDLVSYIRSFKEFSALVITSPRGVRALSESIKEVESEVLQKVKEYLSVFTVGPASHKALNALGFNAVSFPDKCSASLLGQHLATQSFSKPLLIISGDRRRPELTACLTEASVRFQELTVYKTTLNARVRDLLPPLGVLKRCRWVVFFSPSGVECAQKYLDMSREKSADSKDQDDTSEFMTIPWSSNHLKFAAIGNTTARSLSESGWSPSVVAKEPSPACLVEGCLEFDKSNSNFT